MTYTLLAESYPVARKQHRCIWCGEHIEPGEKYRREKSVFDGGMQNFAWHAECSGAQQDEFENDPGFGGEFEAYQNERPAPSLSSPKDAATERESFLQWAHTTGKRDFYALSLPAWEAWQARTAAAIPVSSPNGGMEEEHG